jgi:rfaE bifunctional protein nucleotidyltransferase chain/domain
LTAFAPLAAVPGVRLISLQKGYGSEQVGKLKSHFEVVELDSELNPQQETFVDTAAIMKHLDLVVTVDTAIAHLAGGLGVPVWVVLSQIVDCRWLCDREDSPWYPSMRLFRQSQLGKWHSVFERMAEELRKQVTSGQWGRLVERVAEEFHKLVAGAGGAATPNRAGPATALSTAGKLVDWPHLLEIRAQARQQGRTVVWTNGCFDLLHIGHVRTLEAARRFGDLLIVGINSDAAVHQLKGPGRPLVPVGERAELLAALSCVDFVVVFDQTTPETVLSQLRPDVHCKGADYAPPDGKPIPEAAVVKAYGGRVEFLPLVPSCSTTGLVQRIRSEERSENG